MPDYTDEYLAALRRERDGYERAGNTDRVKAVDAEIKRVESLDDAVAEQALSDADPIVVSDDRATDLQAPSSEAKAEAAKHGRVVPNTEDRARGDVRVDDPPSPDVVKEAPLGEDVLSELAEGGDADEAETTAARKAKARRASGRSTAVND